jgi:hypothetical protein
VQFLPTAKAVELYGTLLRFPEEIKRGIAKCNKLFAEAVSQL